MKLYMVHRDLNRRTPEQLAAIQKAATDLSQQFSAGGKLIRYLCTTLLPGQTVSICWFEAPDITLVKEVNEAADLPFTQITEPPSALTRRLI
jgi:hypothetical protein